MISYINVFHINKEINLFHPWLQIGKKTILKIIQNVYSRLHKQTSPQEGMRGQENSIKPLRDKYKASDKKHYYFI